MRSGSSPRSAPAPPAWVRKDASIDHLLRVIRGVVRGETWLPPTELGGVLRLLIEGQDDRQDRDELLAALTPREQEVLFHLVQGAGRKEVADGCSCPRTQSAPTCRA